MPEDIFHKNKEKNIEEFLKRKIVLESKPLRLGVIVTNFCNLRCIMCPESRYKGGLTLPESALPKIEEMLPYLERIDWQGGEFFTFGHLKKIFHTCKAYSDITHEITTNGLLLDEEWIELFLELNTGLTFSIDSTVKDTYEYIRQGGHFDMLIKNLNLIKKLEYKHNKILRRNITVVVMKSNYRNLRDFVDFAKQFGFGSLLFTPVLFWQNEENIFASADYDAGYLNEAKQYIKNKC
ncbi:MAG: radical SAM protein, partial [Candidatus Omnitrophica bacterium]|nr:radical SAM protein [Candidatus Omnitrophota bacterium]